VTELREEVASRVREWREKRRRSAESLIEMGRASALREAIAGVEALIANARFLPAIAAANAALERFPNEPKLVQLRLDAQRAADRSPAKATARSSRETPTPGAEELNSVFAQEPERSRQRALAIGACILVVVALGVILFVYGPFGR
jgi:hypothetical protein